MNMETKLSSKGQVVIPKDIRDALRLLPGERLQVSRQGRRIVIEAVRPRHEKISYEEFRRRVPRYEGAPVPVEEMTGRIGELFRDWKD